MKKRFVLIFTGLISFILIIGLVSFTRFMSTTISSSNVLGYCIDNTAVHAASFVRYEVSSDPLYAFWISKDSVSNAQEVFIFRKERFGLMKGMTRFSFVYHTAGSASEGIGSVMFMPHDANDKKKPTNLLVFYSSNQQRITNYTLTYEENGDECVRKGKVSTEQEFIISISDLGVHDGVTRKFIKAEFYDDEGKLVETKH